MTQDNWTLVAAMVALILSLASAVLSLASTRQVEAHEQSLHGPHDAEWTAAQRRAQLAAELRDAASKVQGVEDTQPRHRRTP